MGHTILCTDLKVKNLEILKKALVKVLGWKKEAFISLTPEQMKQGKKLKKLKSGEKDSLDGAFLFGGFQNNDPVAMVVKKNNMVDSKGRKGHWSDFAVTMDADGNYTPQADFHNFDQNDVDEFITQELIQEVKGAYGKEAVETYIAEIPQEVAEVETPWYSEGDEDVIRIVVDPEQQDMLPDNNYITI